MACGRWCGRKHAQVMAGSGLANSSARLFSNPAGDYGSMVNERVSAGVQNPFAQILCRTTTARVLIVVYFHPLGVTLQQVPPSQTQALS